MGNNLIKTVALSTLLLAPVMAQASAVITDGQVKLGVDDLGQLNIYTPGDTTYGYTGLRYLPASGGEFESTSWGCLCEGWGVAIADTGVAGYANNALGTGGLTLESFTSTATTATSVVSVGTDKLRVTHAFAPATETDKLFRVTVTIENTSGVDITDLRYRRTFDWDTAPTPFNEYVTIGGTAAATDVMGANDNGFCDSNPLVGCPQILASDDFTAVGPGDIGSNFDFGFGALAAGASHTFDIFYGGADNRDDALAALGEVGAEVYSLGWSNLDADQDGVADAGDAITPTFIFGFSGVGGEAVPDPTPDDEVGVPEPSSLMLLGLGLIGLGAARRKRA